MRSISLLSKCSCSYNDVVPFESSSKIHKNMLKNISKFIDAIEQSFSISKEFLLENTRKQVAEEKSSLLAELKEETGIKVPIVGDFSAGKSSLVNCILGRNGLLPVDITPETAVAYEIYYSETERVELYRDGQKIVEEAIERIKKLVVLPGDIAKVYVNEPIIKKYQDNGIILVDMPGIDSGIKEHNDAILHYISKGTAFALLTDCESGSLRDSTISFITELNKYNLKPAIFLSKIDKKPEDEVANIKEYVEFQAKRAIGDNVYVGCISSAFNNISAFTDFILSLDSDSLVSTKFANRVDSFINLQIVSITALKDITNSNIQDVNEKIKKLEEEKARISRQLIDSVPYADTPEEATQDILDLVKAELNAHAEDIATKVVDNENADTINAMMMNYIRPSIINAFKDESEQYAAAMNAIVDDVSKSLQGSLSISGNFVDGIVENMREEIVGGVQVAADILKAGGVWGQIFGWLLTFFGQKIPDLIRWFFGKSKETIIAEATEKFRFTIIDKIAEQLRPIMFEQVTIQQQIIRESIHQKIANSIDSLQESIKAGSENDSKEDLISKLSSMEEAIAQLNAIRLSL